MIAIEAAKCTGCGICAEACPAGIFLTGKASGGLAALVTHPDRCIGCGHCVALCPADAIAHGGLAVGGFGERKEAAIGAGEMRAFLLSRRSVRTFKQEPVPRELIEQLIEVGTHAGTATNAQTENFVVIRERALLAELETMVMDVLWRRMRLLGSSLGRKLAGLRYGQEMVRRSVLYYERFKALRDTGQLGGAVFRNAPAVVAVHGERANPNVHANCAIAARNMEILAISLGLGTCWAGFFLVAAGMTDKIARRLGVPDDRNIYSAIMLGYPKHAYRKTIPRRTREVRWL